MIMIAGKANRLFSQCAVEMIYGDGERKLLGLQSIPLYTVFAVYKMC